MLQLSDRQLLKSALAALEVEAGIQFEDIKDKPKAAGSDLRWSSRATAWVKDIALRYLIEVHPGLTHLTLGPLVARVRELGVPFLVVARHVSPPLAERLREKGIQFIDCAGNAWLHSENPFLHVWVTGRKPKRPLKKERPVKAFREAGLRVIFPLLCLPDAINAPYRQLAEWAGASLGTVANTMDDLKQLGLIRETGSGRVLEQPDELQRRWVEAYPEQLRPTLNPQRFQVRYTNWWQEFDRHRYAKHQLWLGGEAAAAVLTKYLHPEIITVYGRPDFDKLARELKPARSDDGNLELLEPFWNFDVPDFDAECETYRFCPPLLIYADLVATGEARQLDAAAIVKEKYLAQGSEVA
jgi:hypothetical protein